VNMARFASTNPICLCDNDLILKIFACRLMPQTLALLGVANDDVRILATAIAWFKDNQARKTQKWPPELHDCFDRATVWVIPKAEYHGNDVDELDIFALQNLGVDVGESAFFAVTSLEPLLLTGDRNCLNKIGDRAARANNPRLEAIHSRWKGRVVWFDAILARLMTDSPSLAHSHIWPARSCDGALRDAFPQGFGTPSVEVRDYFRMRVDRVQKHTDGLLMNLS